MWSLIERWNFGREWILACTSCTLWGNESSGTGEKEKGKLKAAATRVSAYVVGSFETEMILQKSQSSRWVGMGCPWRGAYLWGVKGAGYFWPRAVSLRQAMRPPAGVQASRSL